MRESVTRKIPVTVIIGQKEVDNNLVSYREAGSEETTTLSYEKFIKYLEDKISNRK